MTAQENELAESRRCYQDLIKRFEATDEGPAAAAEAASLPVGKLLTVGAHGIERQERFRRSASQALDHLDELDCNGDLRAFVEAMKVWARDALSFNRSGKQFLKQIYEATNDPEATAQRLVVALRLPRDIAEAHRKINGLATEVRRIRSRRDPAPGRSASLASYFWALQDRTNWPISWLSATKLVERLTRKKLPPTSEPADRYQQYQQAIQEVRRRCGAVRAGRGLVARNEADTS